jgi:hypothetical protein
MRTTWIAVGLALALVGCDDSDDNPTVVGATDAELVDASPPDAQPDQAIPDAQVDATPVDAALVDAEPDAAIDAEPDQGPVVPACANGADDDGDGATDYPLDPGCTDATDEDETDPAAAACANGEDDDGDGHTDHPDDPGCATAHDPSEISTCAELHVVRDVTGQRHTEADSTGNPSVFDHTCRANFAPEAIFAFTLRDSVERLVVSTDGSSFDTLLSVRRVCDDAESELACEDDIGPNVRTSRAVVEAPELGDYYFVVDGFRDEQGLVALTVLAELPAGSPCAELDPEQPLTCGAGRVCAEGFCTRARCANEQDDDLDGRVDYPADPGCESREDDDETSPEPLPQCANGIDDDFDGFIDYPDEPHCVDAADDNESRPPQCDDGVDNDGDGRIDLADPGCDDPEDGSEFNLEQCRDGQDNDQDGLTDHPLDPGCESRLDDDETTPDPAPQCANGADDDEDGLTDYPEDLDSCFFAADATEDDPCDRRVFVPITGLRDVRGNTEDFGDDFMNACSAQSDREATFLWTVAEDRPLAGISFDTRGSTFNTVLSVRDACGAAELACDNDSGADRGTSFLTLGAQAPGTTLHVFVDGAFTDANGIFRLRIIPQLAEGANCAAPGDWTCASGLNCTDGTCQPTVCADGLDNDQDGRTDHPFDPGCATPTDDDETDPDIAPQCSNGLDDDQDGRLDFGDLGDGECSSAADDFEGPDCSDGIDNNGNGARDYDLNGDGNRDANADVGCACAADPSEAQQPQCNDGCDNDRDGVIDLEDPGCASPEDDNEFHFPQCIDGLDNDQDGLVDYPNDPGCTHEDDPVERNPEVLPACSDGIDNDEDGRMDYSPDGLGDDGCQAAADDDEIGPCDGDLPEIPEAGQVVGNTQGTLHQHVGSCIRGEAPDVAFVAQVPYPAFVTVDTFGSAYDTALYARSACQPQTQCPDDPVEPEVDAGVPEVDQGVDVDAAIEDAAIEDAAIEDAGVEDAAIDLSVDAALELDAAPPVEPCVAEPTELACNDDTNGVQSEVLFDWPGGPLYLFVDGFGNGSGAYTLNVRAMYPLGGQCGPDSPAWAACEPGSACLEDADLGYPTCQRED